MGEKGKNSEILHNGERYHIQTESWQPEEAVLVTQIFQSGRVVLKTKVKIADQPASAAQIEEAHDKAIEEFKKLLI